MGKVPGSNVNGTPQKQHWGFAPIMFCPTQRVALVKL